MDTQRYTVKIVFRGLCLARKKKIQNEFVGLEILLPDASIVPQPTQEDADEDPRKEALRKVGGFREHHAVLEFPQADWENKSSVTPRLLQVVKPTKEPVGLYLLKKQHIHFGGLYKGTSANPKLPDLLVDEERYTRLENLLLLEHDDEHGFDQLPGGWCEVEDAVAQDNCAAMTLLTVGEASTERRSLTPNGQKRFWNEVRVRDKETVRSFRVLNLDIAVRFTLPIWNPLRITCAPFEGGVIGDERTFLFRPSDPSRGVTVWVKNRELSATLVDSDALPDPYESDCPFADSTDRDHALFVQLAKDPRELTLPDSAGGDASDCGGGCGCGSGG